MPEPDDYLALITASHRSKPKFTAMIRALVEPIVAQQAFVAHLPLDFDLDQAIGAQLDVVGQWVGRSRFVKTPIANVWFSLDDALRGYDQGVWYQPQYDSPSGITRLDDETFRTLLRAKIAANNWDGTLPAAKAALQIIFPNGETTIIVTDNQDMTVTFGVAGVIPSALFIALLSAGYLPLKPETVRADYLITTVGGPLFGFDVQNDLIAGFDTGAWGAPPTYFTTDPPETSMANEFLPLATGGSSNVISQAAYAALAARLTGFQAGIAKSNEINKALRQSSTMAAMLGQFISDRSLLDALDNADLAVLQTRFELALTNWAAVPRAPITLAPSGGQVAILATDHNRLFIRDILTNGGFPLPSIASTPIGSTFIVRMDGTPANAAGIPSITVTGGGNIIHRGVGAATLTSWGRGETLAFIRMADGYLVQVLANSQRVNLSATNPAATVVTGPEAARLIPVLSTLGGSGYAGFGWTGQKLVIPVTGNYFVQLSHVFNASGGNGAATSSITAGPVGSSPVVAAQEADIVNSFRFQLGGNVTNLIDAGTGLEFNYSTANAFTTYVINKVGVTVIYLGRG